MGKTKRKEGEGGGGGVVTKMPEIGIRLYLNIKASCMCSNYNINREHALFWH